MNDLPEKKQQLKIINGKIIDQCVDCDESIYVDRRGVYMCMSCDDKVSGLEDKWGDLPDIDVETAFNGFPDWCPLPDKKSLPSYTQNVREYIVTHLPLPPYTKKKFEEVTPLCFEHGSQYVETVLALGGWIRTGKELDAPCRKCLKGGGK